jgi:hypothetical protein
VPKSSVRFVAQSHTLRNRCVCFVFGVAAASRNTRFQAACWALPGPDLHRLDRTSFAWRTHSITSSAMASRVGGIVRPSTLAVLRLTTNSNLVGCITGRSAGFSPLRIRPA